MWSFSKLMKVYVTVGVVFIVLTVINLHCLSGIENTVIKSFFGHNQLFETINHVRSIIIITNLIGLTLIAFLWRKSLPQNNEQNL